MVVVVRLDVLTQTRAIIRIVASIHRASERLVSKMAAICQTLSLCSLRYTKLTLISPSSPEKGEVV